MTIQIIAQTATVTRPGEKAIFYPDRITGGDASEIEERAKTLAYEEYGMDVLLQIVPAYTVTSDVARKGKNRYSSDDLQVEVIRPARSVSVTRVVLVSGPLAVEVVEFDVRELPVKGAGPERRRFRPDYVFGSSQKEVEEKALRDASRCFGDGVLFRVVPGYDLAPDILFPEKVEDSFRTGEMVIEVFDRTEN